VVEFITKRLQGKLCQKLQGKLCFIRFEPRCEAPWKSHIDYQCDFEDFEDTMSFNEGFLSLKQFSL